MNGLRAVVVCLVIAWAAAVSPAAAVTPAATARPDWSALPVPAAAPPVTVSDLASWGPGEAWATGYEHAADGLRPMLYRWDGRAWSRDTGSPGAGEPGWLGKVQFVGEEVWIFHNRGGAGEILRRSAEGWSTVPLPQTPLVPGPDFLAWDGQSFTEYSEPAVAGEGDSSDLRPAPVPGAATVWSVGRAAGPEGTFAPRILRFG
ncbi:hypothetical protein GCM10009837_75270 [Streptomyces durmitorensis]|uniref:DUF2510 domain-containing protein n=1 Tax=Streptomyces durmitorensis TaxID=319947 RepID=A0ABY4PLB6_9ACTN|nr:hypothetical protein [Streptomyces durmitorensis]UQT53758.1 hypothetical protein M4V62_00960 [Streptomyces durmitorensis]